MLEGAVIGASEICVGLLTHVLVKDQELGAA
jgi:hypothetical protein